MAPTRHPHPTAAGLAGELRALAAAISSDGVAGHSAAIVRLGQAARQFGLLPGAVEALLDPTSAPIVRELAAVRLSQAAERPARRPTSAAPAPDLGSRLPSSGEAARFGVSAGQEPPAERVEH